MIPNHVSYKDFTINNRNNKTFFLFQNIRNIFLELTTVRKQYSVILSIRYPVPEMANSTCLSAKIYLTFKHTKGKYNKKKHLIYNPNIALLYRTSPSAITVLVIY